MGDPREVVSNPEARYFGGRVEEHSLVPLGDRHQPGIVAKALEHACRTNSGKYTSDETHNERKEHALPNKAWAQLEAEDHFE